MATAYDLINTAARDTAIDAIASLADWAQNEERPSTFALFLDIIGYSVANYGESFYGPVDGSRLGYIEREKLTAALIQHLRDADSVERWIDAFMDAD